MSSGKEHFELRCRRPRDGLSWACLRCDDRLREGVGRLEGVIGGRGGAASDHPELSFGNGSFLEAITHSDGGRQTPVADELAVEQVRWRNDSRLEVELVSHSTPSQ